MDASALLLFIVTAANILLGLLVFSRNYNSRQYVYYLCLALSVGIWTATNGLFWILPQDQLLTVALWSYAGAMLVGTFFLLFNRAFSKITNGPDWLILACGCGLAAASLVPGVVASEVTASHEIITTNGIIGFAAMLAALFAWGLILLVKMIRHAKGIMRNQVKLILAGMTVAIAMGVFFNLVLPIFHIYSYVYLGPSFTIIYLGVIAYAIVRHRLFDIRVIAARSVAYIMMLLIMSLLYAISAFALGGFIFHDTSTSIPHEAYNVTLALILAFTFHPLRRIFERATDHIFYRDRYDSQTVLNAFSKILVSELHLDRILKRSLSQLCQDLHIQYGQLVIFHHDRVYRVEHYGPLPRRLMVAPELRKLNRPILVADELEPGEHKSLLDDHGIRVSVSLRTREEFVGYLLLGDKLSGDIYSAQDIELFEIIAKELAVAILNAKSYAEIQDFNITLQARVDHATNRLRVANRHLKELDHAKDEFISMASHQLRTPLTTIKGYLSMLAEGDAGPLTDTQHEFVDYAFTSSERMVNLISDLLNVSRLSAGRFLIQATPTDMVRMIEEEIRQLQSHATAKGLSLTFEKPTTPMPVIEIDENKTRQVIMNFIDNAIYYTQTGGVNVKLTLNGDWVRLEVQDTGIGVPVEARKKLFSKFFRADNAQTIRPDGTGLGLYLAKRVIQDQGGTIIFSSVEGKGSIFGFELPIHPIKPQKPATKEKTHAKS